MFEYIKLQKVNLDPKKKVGLRTTNKIIFLKQINASFLFDYFDPKYQMYI